MDYSPGPRPSTPIDVTAKGGSRSGEFWRFDWNNVPAT